MSALRCCRVEHRYQRDRRRQDSVDDGRVGSTARGPAVVRRVVPTDPDALERRARRSMSRRAWAYVAGGAGQGRTMRHNREAFERWRILPRVLHGVGSRDLRTDVLGTSMPAPLLLAPIGAAELVRADSDVLIARGAAAAGTPYVFSNQGCNPMEQTAQAMGRTPFWYQLYWSTDEDLVDSMIRRAEAAGASALVVTVDTTLLGWRPQDLNLGSLPFARGEGIAQYTSDPRFTAVAAERAKTPTPSGQKEDITIGAIATLLSMSRRYPGPTGRQPALRAAPGGGSDLPRHLLQPVPELGPSGHSQAAHQVAGADQGHPASRRCPSGAASWGWTGSSCPTTAAVRSTTPRPRSTPCWPSGSCRS